MTPKVPEDRDEIHSGDYRLATFNRENAVVMEIALLKDKKLTLLGMTADEAIALGENLILRGKAIQ